MARSHKFHCRRFQVLLVLTGFAVFCVAWSFLWTWRFSQRYGQFGFSGRKMQLTITAIFFIMCWMASRCTSLWVDLFNTFEQPTVGDWIFNFVHTVLTNVGFMTGSTLMCLRIWLIYFHVRLAVANEDNQWISLITQPLAYFPKVVATATAAPEDTGGILEEKVDDGGDEYPRPSYSKSKSKSKRHSRQSSTSNRYGWRKRQFTVHGTFGDANEFGDKSAKSHRPKAAGRWFFANKYKFGNSGWLLARMTCAFVPTVMLAVALQMLHGTYSAFGKGIYFVYGLLVTCVVTTIMYKFPKYRDSLRVCDECVLFAFICAVALLSYVVYFMGFVIRHADDWWVTFYFNMFWLTLGLLVVLTQTKWVVYNFPIECGNQTGNGSVVIHNRTRSGTMTMTAERSILRGLFSFELPCGNCYERFLRQFNSALEHSHGSSIRRVMGRLNTGELKDMRLKDVLSDDLGFRYFMSFLFSEFSYENLLCLIEVTQFMECMVKTKREEKMRAESEPANGDSPKPRALSTITSAVPILNAFVDSFTRFTTSVTSAPKEDDMTGIGSLFPPSVAEVKSSIVWNTRLCNEQKFVVLVTKYIGFDAEMSVNISYGTRRRLLELSEYLTSGVLPPKAEDMLPLDENVFGAVVAEMFRLMCNVLTRFKRTADYCTVQTEWNLRMQLEAEESMEVVIIEDIPVEPPATLEFKL